MTSRTRWTGRLGADAVAESGLRAHPATQDATTESATTESAARQPLASEAGPSSAPRWRWIAAMLAGVWLIFLVTPLLEGWNRRTTVAGWIGIASTVVFGAAYVAAFSEIRDKRSFQLTVQVPRRRAAWRLGTLLGLGVVMTVSLGPTGLACSVYLAVAAVMFLPNRVALVLTLLIGLLAWLIPALVPGWNADPGLSISVLISAFAMWGVKQLMRRNVDLVMAEHENARLAVVQERGRMARDLHDILGHSLTVITVKAELAGRLFDADPVRARAELSDLERLSRDALSDVRRAVEGYRELTLPGEITRARSALNAAQIGSELPGSVDAVPSDLREVFAWAVREGVTNVIRHSRATLCRISLSADRVEIVDDGVGRGSQVGSGAGTGDGAHLGNGLRGLSERAAAAGAVLVTGNVEPTGFSLTLRTRHDG